jgi:imidazolonepropionase
LSQLLLLRGAKQLLTLRGPRSVRRGAELLDLGIIEDGAVLIRDGLIAEVGSSRRVENLKHARTAIEVPADDRIVMPGFVDANVTLSLDGPDPCQKNFRQRRSVAELYERSLSLVRSCVQHGTLTAELKAGGCACDRRLDLAVLRKLAEIGGNPLFTVRTWRLGKTAEEPANGNLLRTFTRIDRTKLVRFIEFSGRLGQLADLELLAALNESDIGVKLSWSPGSAEELFTCLEQFHPTAVYCAAPTFLTGEEALVLSAAGTIAVLGAGKEVFEGPASRSARNLVDAGAAIALSSGYDSASAANSSMQISIALAVSRLGLTPEEALSAATINSAYAVGRGDVTGTIEVGKQADLLLLNASDYRDMASQFGVNHVAMAIRGGNVVLNRTRWKATHN